MIRVIAAIDDKRGIAAPDCPPWNIPWNIPLDMAHFRQLTTGASILMGRSTYEKYPQPLPGRQNLVASRSLMAVRPSFQLINNVDDLLEDIAADIWVIGGAALYASALQYCQELHITHVAGDYTCDLFFPNFTDMFMEHKRSALMHQNGYDFQYVVYKKNR